VPNYDEAPEIDLQSVLQSSGGGGGGQSPFQQNQQQDIDRIPLEERIDQIKEIIYRNVDEESWPEGGGTTGAMYDLNNTLIITNTPKNHREIRSLLSKLRESKAMQINVETRFLLVAQDFFEQVGFDLDVYFNAENNQIRAARAADPTVLPSDFFDFGAGGVKRSVTGAGVDTDGDGQVDAFLTQGVVNPNPWSPIGSGQNSLGLAQTLMPGEGIGAAILGQAPALGIAGQFLDDIQVDFLVKATQADRRSVQLTAPRLTFTNGQTSNIYVVTQQSFVSDLQPVVSDSAVGFDPELEVVSEGVAMLVEGQVTADRRYVLLNVDTAVSQIEGFAQQAITAVAGGQLVSSDDAQSFIQLPTVTVTRVQTTVTVPDQGTVLLGGQRLVNETEVETGVPVLSKIPILNRFFSNRIEAREEQTLLILIKPTILIQTEQEESSFPGLGQTLGGLGG
jgi:general secretion pathway protein D